MFYHSLISDWNHGNAHFLRGIYASLQGMGHEVLVYEPKDNWSLTCLLKERGNNALVDFIENFPNLKTNFYGSDYSELIPELWEADLVIVHEWTDSSLVTWLGEQRRRFSYLLFFHDTHHRAVSDPQMMQNMDLSAYDAVLAFGESLKRIYELNRWHSNVYTWHEAADTTHYYPMKDIKKVGDVVWIGNWGDDERTEELEEFLIEPITKLNLKATFYGVRYPEKALKMLKSAGITYGGYLPTSQVSATFSQYKATVHVPRRFYSHFLPGIPTIRPFEALACGIPLLSSPWLDRENLFTIGKDFMMAQNGKAMTEILNEVIVDQRFAENLSRHGLRTILAKHTCLLRAEQLLTIYTEVKEEIEAA